MRCFNSAICVNWPNKCKECFTTSSLVNTYPYFVKRSRLKFKIFFGNHTSQTADEKLNQWLAENPAVELIDWQYQEPRIGDHSICITYKEKEKDS